MLKIEMERLAVAGTAAVKSARSGAVLLALSVLLVGCPAYCQDGSGPGHARRPITGQRHPGEGATLIGQVPASPEHAGMLPALPRGKAGEVVWNRDLPASLSEARRANKLVLVDVYTDWCGWCKKLDRDTYTDPGVIQILKASFVCVKLDAEDGGAGESFARQYRVDGFPCIMVLEPSGKLRGVTYGYRNAQDFSEILNKAIASPQS